nr:kinesin-like protein KIN-7N isoform X2 [Anas platyrhynchos]
MAAEAAAAPPRRVQVCVRLRPGPPGEDPCLLPLDSHTLQLREDPPHAPSCYRFDAVYDAASSTAAVYEGSVRLLLAQFLAGRDVTVLAYGPSGSGKTHTMLGGEGEPGLVQRALEELLQAVGASRRLSVACMEVYCEEARRALSFARGARRVPPPQQAAVGGQGEGATVASDAPESRSPPSTPPPEDQALQRWLEDAENTLQRLKKRRPPPSPPPPPPSRPGAPSPASLVVLRRRQKGCPQWEAVAAPQLEAGVRAHVLQALNGGDPAQLRGLGPRRGGRVRAWRQEHGPFRTANVTAALGTAPLGPAPQ